jgi:hypothetical protein
MEVQITTADDSITYLDGGSGFDYDTAGQFVEAVRELDREPVISFVTAPGEKGAGTQDFKHSTMGFEIDVIYIGDDEETLNAAFNDDLTIMASVMSITVGTVQYDACTLKGNKGAQPKSTGRGTVRKNCTLRFLSGRPPGEQS